MYDSLMTSEAQRFAMWAMEVGGSIAGKTTFLLTTRLSDILSRIFFLSEGMSDENNNLSDEISYYYNFEYLF